MNIQKSFVERNRLKKYISELSNKLSCMEVASEENEKRDWLEFDGETYDQIVDKILEAKNALGALNCAIDEANLKVRPLLNSLESVKAQLGTIQPITNQIRRTKLNVIAREYNEDGKIIEVPKTYKFDIDKDKYIKIEKDLKNKLKDLEDQISEANLATPVSISKELKDFLMSYDK